VAGRRTFHILGPLEVVDVEAGRRLPLGGPKQQAVLALLVLRRRTVVPVARIIEGLWGEEPPASAMGTLQSYISNLRRALEPQRGPGAAPTVLVTEAGGYRLAIDEQDVDAAVFERLLADAEAALDDGRDEEAAALADEARARWRGPVLGDLGYESFATPEVQRLEELHARSAEVWAEAQLACGHHAEVATILPALVADHPLRSRLRGQLMLALYRTGRQAEALRTYAEGRAVLRAEVGAEPEAALQSLEEQILLQDPRLDWRPASAAPVTEQRPPARELLVVGRDEELARLEGAMIAAASGRGSTVLITGEAGIGKTRLAEALSARAAARGATVAWGRSLERDGAPPFWPWVEVLRRLLATDGGASLRGLPPDDLALLARLLPELDPSPGAAAVADGGGGEALRFSLYDAVARCIRALATDRLVVVVLDDAHWADAPTVRLLQLLSDQVATARILLVVTFRDGEVGSELASTLAAMARGAVADRVPLGGLGEGDVGRLLAEALGATPPDELIAEVAERSAGNPFFVGELARSIGDERRAPAGAEGPVGLDGRVPLGVRQVIRGRVEALGEGAATLLTAAAVVGRELDLRVAAEVAGLDPASDEVLELAEAATAARLLEEAPRIGRYRFAHALVQEALLTDVSGLRRARMHHRAAAVLAAGSTRRRGQEELAALAFHALEGAVVGGADAAISYARDASAAAMAALAFEEAAALCDHALRVLARTGAEDDHVRLALQLDLGVALRNQGDDHTARDALAGALETARRLSGEDLAAAALAYSGGMWWSWWTDTGSPDAVAIDALEEALDRIPDGPSALRVALLGRLAVQLHFDPEAERRRDDLSAEALAMARQVGGAAVVDALTARLVAIWRPGNASERRVLADELVAISRTVRSTEAEAFGHHMLTLAALERGDIAAAQAQLGEGERCVRSLPLPHLAAQVAWTRSLLASVVGDFATADRLQLESYAATCRWSEAEARRTLVAQLSTLRWQQGRLEELEDALRSLLAGQAGTVGITWQGGLALLLADCGRLDEARELFEGVAATGFTDIPVDSGRLFSLAVRAEVCALLEDRERAALLLDLLEPYRADSIMQPIRLVYTGPVLFLTGMLRRLLGHHDAALDDLDAALASATRVGARPSIARVRLEQAAALAARRSPGDLDAARTAVEEAEALAGELGMSRVAERATTLRKRLAAEV
jgi:DNA-binding SARP family transcriptional activator